jgi:hypothetical protein
MNERIIELTFNPEHFRELYYSDNGRTIFTDKNSKKGLIFTIATALGILITYYASMENGGISFLIVFFCMIFIPSVIYTTNKITKFLKFKSSIDKYMTELSKIKRHSIRLTENAIELTQDSTITINKWESISSAKVEHNVITMFNQTTPLFFFPAKSMQQKDFETLSEIIRRKIN